MGKVGLDTGSSTVDVIFFALPVKLNLLWTNLSLRIATESATQAHVWRSVGARLHLGQLHKSLIDKRKGFTHISLQTAHSDQISDADKLIFGGIVLVGLLTLCVKLWGFQDLRVSRGA